jgi:AcrR family transcriptional regulator
MDQVTEKDTKERILDVAERLFAEHGFKATSLRTITTEAGVNLAAVNYHFGTKDVLVREVLSRRIRPLNRERFGSLERLQAESENGELSIEQIVEAFVAPAIRMSLDPDSGGHVFMRLFGHAMSQPDLDLRDFIAEQFREVAHRFSGVLQRTLPDLSEREIFWRMLFMIGSMAHSMAMADQLHKVSRGLCDPHDALGILRRLVPFVAAGFRAPLPDTIDEKQS